MVKLSSLVPPPGANKYELAVVAAREARRLNELARHSGDTPGAKVTGLAMKRVLDNEVPYEYEEA